MSRALVLSCVVAMGLAACGTILGSSGDDEQSSSSSSGGSPADGAVIDGAELDTGVGSDATFGDGGDAAIDSGPVKRVFVTAENFSGSSVDFRLASECNLRATSAGLGGTWVAWISTTQQNAKDRIPGDGPWVLVTGEVVAANRAQLLSGALAHPIDRDQTGDAAARSVWTGTTASGDKYFENCGDWKANNGNGMFGKSTEWEGGTWTASMSASCFNTFSLYCFEE